MNKISLFLMIICAGNNINATCKSFVRHASQQFNAVLAEEVQSSYVELCDSVKKEFAEIEQLHNSNEKEKMIFVGYRLARVSEHLRHTLASLEMNNSEQVHQFNQMVQKYLEEQKICLKYDRGHWQDQCLGSRYAKYALKEAMHDTLLANGLKQLNPNSIIPPVWINELTEMGKDPVLRDLTINEIKTKIDQELFKALNNDDQKKHVTIRNKVSLLKDMLSIVQFGTTFYKNKCGVKLEA